MQQGDMGDEIKSKIGKLTRWEKRRIKAGDKTILFQRLGIAEDQDINRLKKKFGIKSKLDEQNIEEILDERSNIGKRKSRRKILQENEQKEILKNLLMERNIEDEENAYLDESELLQKQKEKAKI